MLTTGDSFEIQRQKLKVKEWKRYSLQIVTKRAGLALLISNQDIKSKKVYKREKKTLYINKRFSTTKRYNYKH